jgi:hypothetical protein
MEIKSGPKTASLELPGLGGERCMKFEGNFGKEAKGVEGSI